jgi:CubicO group peptidase (beta-lactamase class C family)
MRIQSMTKPVTSVAALRLVEAGRLGLDQSLDEWLTRAGGPPVLSRPDAHWTTQCGLIVITLRHLLTNTSG